MYFILSIPVIGILIIFGLSRAKIENSMSSHFNHSHQDFGSFLAKIKGNSSKIKRWYYKIISTGTGFIEIDFRALPYH